MRRRHETLDRTCRRNLAGGLSCDCERAGKLRSDTSRTGAHRLLPWPKSVLSCAIGPCRCQSARAIRRRVVSDNYRNSPSETQTTSATIKVRTVCRSCAAALRAALICSAHTRKALCRILSRRKIPVPETTDKRTIWADISVGR